MTRPSHQISYAAAVPVVAFAFGLIDPPQSAAMAESATGISDKTIDAPSLEYQWVEANHAVATFLGSEIKSDAESGDLSISPDEAPDGDDRKVEADQSNADMTDVASALEYMQSQLIDQKRLLTEQSRLIAAQNEKIRQLELHNQLVIAGQPQTAYSLSQLR